MGDRYKRMLAMVLLVSAALSPFVFFSTPLKSWQNPNKAVTLLQDALYPVELMPGWLQVINHGNPLSYEVEALRHLMIGVMQIRSSGSRSRAAPRPCEPCGSRFAVPALSLASC